MSEADASPRPVVAVEAPVQASALRMILSLGGAGALAGLLIVVVFDATFETIQAHKAELLRQAVAEVLKGPARYETHYLSLSEQRVFRELPAGQAEQSVQEIYFGFDAEDRPTGVAVEAAEAGFQDVISLIYGFDPRAGKLLGMKVLASRETPGLGDKIEKDRSFVGQFDGARPPLEAVKRGTGAPGEIDAITGATISSRAVVRMINRSLERVRAPVEAHVAKGRP